MKVQLKKDNKSAEVFLYDDIGEDWFGGVSAKSFAKEIKGLPKSVEQIDLHINSYGGSVFDGIAMYNTLKRSTAKVTAYVDGIAASAATIVALGASEIVANDGSMFMIHNPWSGAMGEASSLRHEADKLDQITDEMAKMYMVKSGKDEKEVKDIMDAETWYTASDALSNGFVDSVNDEQAQLAACANKAMKFKHPLNVVKSKPIKTEVSFENRIKAAELSGYMKSKLNGDK